MTGDPNVLQPEKWAVNYADYLYSYAITRVNNEDTARDLVQDTFLAALQKRGSFEGRSTERTWLTAILRFKIIDVYRKKANGLTEVKSERIAEAAQQDFFDERGHWQNRHYPEPFASHEQDLFNAKEFNAVLYNCLEKLPSLWMSAFTLKHVDEETTDVICESLRITQANYWTIIHRAKLNLRECLQKSWI